MAATPRTLRSNPIQSVLRVRGTWAVQREVARYRALHGYEISCCGWMVAICKLSIFDGSPLRGCDATGVFGLVTALGRCPISIISVARPLALHATDTRRVW